MGVKIATRYDNSQTPFSCTVTLRLRFPLRPLRCALRRIHPIRKTRTETSEPNFDRSEGLSVKLTVFPRTRCPSIHPVGLHEQSLLPVLPTAAAAAVPSVCQHLPLLDLLDAVDAILADLQNGGGVRHDISVLHVREVSVSRRRGRGHRDGRGGADRAVERGRAAAVGRAARFQVLGVGRVRVSVECTSEKKTRKF